MNKMTEDNFEAVCSVTEMAGRLDMSRARFYQLQKLGVFPPPVYCIRTKRPLYPLDLQKKCVRIRETGIGDNGQLSAFYAPRKKAMSKKPAPKAGPEECYSHLVGTLKEMGLKTNTTKVKVAVKKRFPNGLTLNQIDDMVIIDLFKYLISGGQK